MKTDNFSFLKIHNISSISNLFEINPFAKVDKLLTLRVCYIVRYIERVSVKALIPRVQSSPSNKQTTTSSCGFLRHERWRTNEHLEKGDARHSTPIDRHSVACSRNDRARWSALTAEKLPCTSSTMQHDRVLSVAFTSLSKIM